jgi:predicted SAM-dependent methyltransferase
MRVIIGAGKTNIEGWSATQEDDLDLLSTDDWDKLFALESIEMLCWQNMYGNI